MWTDKLTRGGSRKGKGKGRAFGAAGILLVQNHKGTKLERKMKYPSENV